MWRKPYFLDRTTENMELVWKKNNGPQHLTIHASVALLAVYSTYRCIRCTLVWFFQEKWVIYLTLEYPVQGFSTFEMFSSANQNKQLPNHGANLESHDARPVFMTINTKKKGVVKHTRWKKSDMKESYEPFLYSMWRTVCSKRETSR